MSSRILRTARPAAACAVAALIVLVGAALAHAGEAKGHTAYAFGTSDQDHFAYVVVTEGGKSLSGSGDLSDYDDVRDLSDRYGPEFLWARLDGKSYVIDDPRLVEEAIDAMEPVRMLGVTQGKLGAQQGALGARQGKLGAEQAKLGARQAVLGARQALLSERIARMQDRGESTRRLRYELDAIHDEQSAIGREQSRIGRVQSELGAQQSPLGRQQSELGQRQAELSKKLHEEMLRLVERAIDRNLAERVH